MSTTESHCNIRVAHQSLSSCTPTISTEAFHNLAAFSPSKAHGAYPESTILKGDVDGSAGPCSAQFARKRAPRPSRALLIAAQTVVAAPCCGLFMYRWDSLSSAACLRYSAGRYWPRLVEMPPGLTASACRPLAA